MAAREKLLSTALEMLGTGRPETVSINMVAKEAGLSWGSVQNLFGDSDGFWSAVVELIIDNGSSLWAEPQSPTVEGRVAEIAQLYRSILDSPYGVAVETVRAGLPRPLEVLEQTHPLTAASLAKLDDLWSSAFTHFFENLDGPALDTQRARDVAEVLPSALRGLRADQQFGTAVDFDRAHRTLVSALTGYLAG
ncbi:hypothetical protein GCM10022237_35100 [Nocardioides ginsengisoli]|uniref:TetR/AcrR family transcriptional regulator n=1 Tax=Nocardioides ginsengisoli TaxID=363868 RepID=A0ABW3W5W3_9ACTN